MFGGVLGASGCIQGHCEGSEDVFVISGMLSGVFLGTLGGHVVSTILLGIELCCILGLHASVAGVQVL